MTNVFIYASSQNDNSLIELNAHYSRAKTRLAAARLAGDQEAQGAASAELIELDEAIATVLANLALRNAGIARLHRAAA
jgi:hypothetical protein